VIFRAFPSSIRPTELPFRGIRSTGRLLAAARPPAKEIREVYLLQQASNDDLAELVYDPSEARPMVLPFVVEVPESKAAGARLSGPVAFSLPLERGNVRPPWILRPRAANDARPAE